MNQRPILFSAALFLSATGGSLYLLVCIAMSLFYSFFAEKIISITNLLSMQGSSPSYFLILALFSALSLSGIFLLYKNRKNGYFIYLLAQTGILFLPPLFLGENAFSVLNAIFTVLFATIYLLLYLEIRKATVKQKANTP